MITIIAKNAEVRSTAAMMNCLAAYRFVDTDDPGSGGRRSFNDGLSHAATECVSPATFIPTKCCTQRKHALVLPFLYEHKRGTLEPVDRQIFRFVVNFRIWAHT